MSKSSIHSSSGPGPVYTLRIKRSMYAPWGLTVRPIRACKIGNCRDNRRGTSCNFNGHHRRDRSAGYVSPWSSKVSGV